MNNLGQKRGKSEKVRVSNRGLIGGKIDQIKILDEKVSDFEGFRSYLEKKRVVKISEAWNSLRLYGFLP